MKSSWIVFISAFIISVGINLFLLHRLIGYKRQLRQQNEFIASIVPERQVTILENHLKILISSQGAKLVDGPVLNVNNGTASILTEIIEQPTLVFKYKESDCRQCIDFGLIKLKGFVQRMNSGNSMVLAESSDKRLVQILKDQHQLSEIPFLQTGQLSSAMDTLDYPYFFILSPSDLSITNVFFPDKSYPRSTDLYLSTLEKKEYFR